MSSSEVIKAACAAVDGERNAKDEKPSDAIVEQLSPDQLSKWAQLVADGDTEFPPGLAPALEERMVRAVRRLRCARLFTFVARQIAQSIVEEDRAR